jgi:hypothetical protein
MPDIMHLVKINASPERVYQLSITHNLVLTS